MLLHVGRRWTVPLAPKVIACGRQGGVKARWNSSPPAALARRLRDIALLFYFSEKVRIRRQQEHSRANSGYYAVLYEFLD